MNCGIHDAAVGAVALPVLNVGPGHVSGGPPGRSTSGGTVNEGNGGGAQIPGGNGGVPDPASGGGNAGVPVVWIGGSGLVAEPLANTGCCIPGTEGGTGAGTTGGSAMVRLVLAYDTLDRFEESTEQEAAAGDMAASAAFP